jgi:hypothetical protein
MPLFQQSVVSKYLSGGDKPAPDQAFQRFREFFHNPERQKSIRQAKEEQYRAQRR